jgi:hypothetical protein
MDSYISDEARRASFSAIIERWFRKQMEEAGCDEG